MNSSSSINKIFVAGVGISSQLISILKLLFGRPQVMILESVAVNPENTKKKGQLMRSLSTVFNADQAPEELLT
jgi:hypothetical protein